MKDFLLLANVNACAYKEFFPLLKKDKARGGYNFNKTLMFETTEGGHKDNPLLLRHPPRKHHNQGNKPSL